MDATRLSELVKGIGFTKNGDTLITSVTTDSRKVTPGSVFVAVRGDRLDGHSFVGEAAEKGAVAVLVDHAMPDCGVEQIVVKDTKDAFIALAGNYRAKYNPKIIGVTGSVGKTTTKEMTGAILSAFGSAIKTEGNQNNEIGCPSTLLNIDGTTELAVVEMGMNNLGDIHKLTMAARPDVAIITAIGVSHLENLKTKENILKAKLEIVDGLPEDGILVINGDDDLLMSAKNSVDREVVTFAIRNSECDVVATNIMTRRMTTEFTIDDRHNGRFRAIIPAIGEHNILDAIAGYTAATRAGLDPAKSAEALNNYRPTGMRQKLVEFQDITVFEDCYNASPDSMVASLSMLASLQVSGIKVAVLGDMLELGSISEESHKQIGIFAAKCGIDVLLCYGPEMRACAKAATAAGVACVAHFEDKKELAEYLSKTVHAGDAVIFKASRGMALEDAIEHFYKIRNPGA